MTTSRFYTLSFAPKSSPKKVSDRSSDGNSWVNKFVTSIHTSQGCTTVQFKLFSYETVGRPLSYIAVLYLDKLTAFRDSGVMFCKMRARAAVSWK